MSTSPISLGPKILGAGAVALALFLLVGLLLPAVWEASASAHLPEPPETVFSLLDSPEGWRTWTPWPESGVQRSGPTHGAGARLSWDDPELGSGSFTLTRVAEPLEVEYRVEVGASMRTTGVMTLAPENGGTRITWQERGDLGRNPLMGYWALSMGRAQSEELSKSLDRLAAAVDARADVD